MWRKSVSFCGVEEFLPFAPTGNEGWSLRFVGEVCLPKFFDDQIGFVTYDIGQGNKPNDYITCKISGGHNNSKWEKAPKKERQTGGVIKSMIIE